MSNTHDQFLTSLGYILNPIITVVPGSCPMQEVLDGNGNEVATLVHSIPPTINGVFTSAISTKLTAAGFIVEAPNT